jgi:hypothetical protein
VCRLLTVCLLCGCVAVSLPACRSMEQEPDSLTYSRSKPAARSSLGGNGRRVVSRPAEEPVRRGMQLGA